MIQQQIEQFVRSLQNTATQYSDPSMILQHIPVLRSNLMMQQNPEILFYGLAAIVGLFFLKRALSKRRKANTKNIGFVMPAPHFGKAHHASTSEIAPASFEKESHESTLGFDDELPALPKRSIEQQLEDVSAISFTPRTALTPDEARMRVLVQAVLNEFGAGYMIMARTSLGTLLEPGLDVFGPERAHALTAIQDKCIDFGVFDRAGRCIIALDVCAADQSLGSNVREKTIVQAALTQARLPMVKLRTSDTIADIRTNTGPYLKPTARVRPTSSRPNKVPQTGRPVRPIRPAHAAAIAAR
jgi:hypothetical protein